MGCTRRCSDVATVTRRVQSSSGLKPQLWARISRGLRSQVSVILLIKQTQTDAACHSLLKSSLAVSSHSRVLQSFLSRQNRPRAVCPVGPGCASSGTKDAYRLTLITMYEEHCSRRRPSPILLTQEHRASGKTGLLVRFWGRGLLQPALPQQRGLLTHQRPKDPGAQAPIRSASKQVFAFGVLAEPSAPNPEDGLWASTSQDSKRAAPTQMGRWRYLTPRCLVSLCILPPGA